MTAGLKKVTQPGALLAVAVAMSVIAILTVSFAIAFASIIYTGPLAAYAHQGIGLALLGGILLPIVAALLSSYRGIVSHLQEVPAVLLSISAASIMAKASSPDIGFASVVTFIGFTSIITGLVIYLAGSLKLGFVARFIPYSVIAGFLAATGLLLVLGALAMITKQEVSVVHLARIFGPGMPATWLPWMGFGLGAVALTRLIKHSLVLPGIIVLAASAFYLVLFIRGVSIEQAGQMGLLIGPFEGADLLEGLSPTLALEADWNAILAQMPTIFAVASMALLGLLLNVSGIEISIGRELNPERELKALGVGNVLTGLTGGSISYHLLGETTLANKMGVTGLAAPFAVAISSASVLFFGASLIGNLPVGLMGGIVAYLGFDFLYEWVWKKREKLPAADRVVILLIVAIAGSVGFLTAFSVGLILATVLFVVSYAGIDIVRLRSTGAVRRSSVERGAEDLARLEVEAADVVIYELAGFLFFGTANGLYERINNEIHCGAPPRHVILDFRGVKGLDTSASFALTRIAALLDRSGLELTLTGLSPKVKADVLRPSDFPDRVTIMGTLDDALMQIEAGILSDVVPEGSPEEILNALSERYPSFDFSTFASVVSLAPGETLFVQGAASNEVFRLVSGVLRAEATSGDGQPLLIARFLPGAIIGEIAYYADIPRTASMRADTKAVALRFDLDRIADTPDGLRLANEFHREAARHLALRLNRMTLLLRQAGI
ncbi:SulP family inorganic anion transporter [Sedimentimonas flavescens]|uniref:SulP family inorganic anion transporter n=1 Tax=Sedimentimonas flavescens TaxID=2851012 RepID=UPI001C4A1DF2|nr:SulP family inorganic anion transporter [Sedimentimonas flavescens]MBW0159136.1 cyclic nucleotide-binding domain-containing protein [Sedimentimonas flavescens]